MATIYRTITIPKLSIPGIENASTDISNYTGINILIYKPKSMHSSLATRSRFFTLRIATKHFPSYEITRLLANRSVEYG